MSKTLFTVLLASAFVLPLAAHADTIDDFVLTGDGHTITYSLPASTAPTASPILTFFESAPTTIDGVSGFVESSTYNFPTISIPSMLLDVPADFGVPQLLLAGPFLFTPTSVPTSNPFLFDTVFTFNPGIYTLQSVDLELQPFNPPVFYTLTITPETTPPAVPEPSTLALFTTGVFGLGSLVRRPSASAFESAIIQSEILRAVSSGDA